MDIYYLLHRRFPWLVDFPTLRLRRRKHVVFMPAWLLDWIRTSVHDMPWSQPSIRTTAIQSLSNSRQDPAYWACYPYYMKHARDGDRTFFRHIDVDVKTALDRGRGANATLSRAHYPWTTRMPTSVAPMALRTAFFRTDWAMSPCDRLYVQITHPHARHKQNTHGLQRLTTVKPKSNTTRDLKASQSQRLPRDSESLFHCPLRKPLSSPGRANSRPTPLSLDHKQLPPLVFSKLTESPFYGQLALSLLTRLQINSMIKGMFTEQHCMVEQLCSFVSNCFYKGQLRTVAAISPAVPAISNTIVLHHKATLHQARPLVFLDIAGAEDQHNTHDISVINPNSCTAVVALAKDLITNQINLLSPYGGQAQVSTVHDYQGKKNMLVVVDFTACSSLLFASDPHRSKDSTGQGGVMPILYDAICNSVLVYCTWLQEKQDGITEEDSISTTIDIARILWTRLNNKQRARARVKRLLPPLLYRLARQVLVDANGTEAGHNAMAQLLAYWVKIVRYDFDAI
ncbi:uncharacterized protein DSM5745_02636 [Aspergillus mulundensis]|uniref:DNA2/NAM7 helicase-like C-terminal domain-containing protein n=1 Tax=Aspergillus mulundensis TaxID=1810919 RepID=A0A3D8SXG7_9EURO|nr:hypothetical protein DSM5745_02636 [Aspergillus mulundensis]RDW90861.1 hypothetical protein DSM5745_02636 [Aspergillus mulundensis]